MISAGDSDWGERESGQRHETNSDSPPGGVRLCSTMIRSGWRNSLTKTSTHGAVSTIFHPGRFKWLRSHGSAAPAPNSPGRAAPSIGTYQGETMYEELCTKLAAIGSPVIKPQLQ